MPIANFECVTRPMAAAASRFTAADFERHVERLKSKLGDEHFTILVEPPFVVIGDEAADRVQDRAGKDTVKWAVDRLKAIYFERDPEFIIDIWLFATTTVTRSTPRNCSAINHTRRTDIIRPTSSLVMNIATGGGTLVHEIVHPFVAANFAACPSWFNEGLASLYEQSGEEHGQIDGFVNWRFNGLQRTIRAGRLPTFEALCSTTTDEFYNRDEGANYGQARYLCLYFQEHDLLKKFYDQFHDSAKTDPTGYHTLQSVLEEKDMADFQKRWETWVLLLRRPD